MAGELLEELRTIERYRRVPPARLEQIANITAKLRKAKLFEPLSTAELAYIAEKGHSVEYKCGDKIIAKGDTDKTFYVIVVGQVRVWVGDDSGVPHLLNYHWTGDFFGEMAPLNDAPRAANVDVVDDVELIAFDLEGFERISKHSQISNYLSTWGHERIEKSIQPFEGKHWDEISIIVAHKSWFALARVVLFPATVTLLTLATFGLLVAYSRVSFELLVSLVIAVTVGMGLWIFWMYEDWRNDDLIVTSKRVIHIERVLVPPFPIERHEASLFQVQDITTRNLGLWTSLFNVQTLEIKTAGAGTIQFPYLDSADDIRNQIFEARVLARARRQGQDYSHIRQKLFTEINRPTSEVMPLESGEETPVTPERKGLIKLVDYLVPRMRVVKQDQIIWRKHWIILLQEAGLAALVVVLSVTLLGVGFVRPGFLGRIPLHLTVAVPAVAVAVSFAWYLWHYDGWRNDVYIVTNERIIDIEGSPFHLQKESRREGTFDVIQNTDYSSPNWIFRVLRIGDVTIDTAAEQKAFTFTSVPRPEEVQQEIFKRLTAFKERQEQAERERRYSEYTRWFGEYHRSVMEQKEQ
jgi:hypothetical protein